MVRGLDGLFDLRSMPDVALCGFEGPPSGVVSRRFPVAMARGKHLFPFRTEQLSPSAPMVLGPQGPGRVGRRRFSFTRTGRPFGGGFSALRARLPCAFFLCVARNVPFAARASVLAGPVSAHAALVRRPAEGGT